MIRALTLSFVIISVAGCGSKPAPENTAPAPAKPQGVSIDSAAPQQAAPAPETAGAPPPPTPAETAPQNSSAPATDLQGSTELDDLTKLLQQFVVERKRFPTDLNEMSKLMGVRLPALPPGAALVIDKENQQVRYVPPKK